MVVLDVALSRKKNYLTYDASKIVHGLSKLDPTTPNLDMPCIYFLHYFTPDFLQKIMDEINLYAIQTNSSQTQACETSITMKNTFREIIQIAIAYTR